MILFFRRNPELHYAVGHAQPFSKTDIDKLVWLFGGAQAVEGTALEGQFVGPRKEMITPWSTNAVEITQTMGISGIERIEEFVRLESGMAQYDRLLRQLYSNPDQDIFTIHHQPEPIRDFEDIAAYSEKEGLALSKEEIDYLNEVSKKLQRKLTDSEVFGFSQVNSEHCRHKIFNGTFVIDGKQK